MWAHVYSTIVLYSTYSFGSIFDVNATENCAAPGLEQNLISQCWPNVELLHKPAFCFINQKVVGAHGVSARIRTLGVSKREVKRQAALLPVCARNSFGPYVGRLLMHVWHGPQYVGLDGSK